MRRWRRKAANRYREKHEAARRRGTVDLRAMRKTLWNDQAEQLYEMELGVASYYARQNTGGFERCH